MKHRRRQGRRELDFRKTRGSKPPAANKGCEDVLLGPWFLGKKVFGSIRHLLPHDYWRRMSYFFEDYGCLRCGRKDLHYGANGMCHECFCWVKYRVAQSMRKRKEEPPEIQQEPKEKLYAFRRKKANALLAGLVPRRPGLQRARKALKSRSWRIEKVQMPFGTVEFLS